jgi:hypothetical protein
VSSLTGQSLLVVGSGMTSASVDAVEDPADNRMIIVTRTVVVVGRSATWKIYCM